MSLITDTTPLHQPEGTYPFGLNLVNSTKNNATTAVSSEPGTRLVHTYSSGYEVIGEIYFDNKVLVFSTDDTTSNIGVIEDHRYNTIYEGDLNFNKSHKILGQHRTLKGCEDVFYFQDGINPDRYFNLNDVPTTPDEFNMRQVALEPNIEVEINNTGGTMPSGGVSFQLRYVDLEGNVFDTSEPTISYPVYSDNVSAMAEGSITTTQKSATINVSNLDTRFPYVKLIAIHNVEGTYEAYEIDNVIPTNDELTIEYQGPTGTDVRIDSRDVQVDKAQYNNSLVSEQVLGRLLRANIQEITEDYSTHQRLVNNIIVLPEITQIPKTEFSQDPNSYTNLTLQSDEVYALGLRFKDSTLVKQPTPVYHIPGRAARTNELEDITFNGETYKRFQVENTAQQLNRSIKGMGYYEVSNTYPNIRDSNGEYVYGSLQGTPIRHHRMPSRRTVMLENGGSLQSINLTLDNVVYPTGYDSHELLYVPRTSANSTVLDSGYAHKGRFLNAEYYVSSQLIDYSLTNSGVSTNTSEGANVFSLNSPEALLGMNQKGNYVDLINEYVYDLANRVTTSSDASDQDQPNVGLTEVPSTLARNINAYTSYDNLVVIAPQSKDVNTLTLPTLNFDYLNSVTVAELGFNAQEYSYTYYVNKLIKSVNSNLQALTYKTLNEIDGRYTGDTFISRFYNLTLAAFNSGSKDTAPAGGFVINDLWVESKINYELTHGDHFKLNNDTYNYVADINLEKRDGDYFFIEPDYEEYRYNEGYKFDSLKSYFSLPISYDYSNTCKNQMPYRIIFSPQSFQEELSDSYLITNTNDYIDLPSSTGPITGLKYKNNRLYVHTTQTTYVLTPNPQYLSTNQEVAQLQSGDFLSVPPQEIIQADHGYGGMHDKTASINCEFGYFWVDGLRGSLNSIEQSFKSLSNEGMISWFKNNLTVDSKTTLGFDPYFSRLIMTTRNPDDTCQPFHTLSYSLLQKTFTSFHTHNPDYYLNTSTTMYKGVKNKIRRQTKDELFEQHPVVIEQVTKSLQTQNLISLSHYTEFFEGDNEVVDTFDSLVVYNSNQSTGTLRLFLGGAYSNLLYNQSTRPVSIVDKNHNISSLYDNATSRIVTGSPCGEALYTDKLFINTDTNSSAYDRSIFKEKYTIARLTYKPTTSRRMTHYLLHQNKQQSIR